MHRAVRYLDLTLCFVLHAHHVLLYRLRVQFCNGSSSMRPSDVPPLIFFSF
jgi:hypothetical protein